MDASLHAPLDEGQGAVLTLSCIPLALSKADLAAYGRMLGGASPGEAAGALATAIACGSCWRRYPTAVIALRIGPQPALAVVGRFTAAQLQRVLAQANRLQATLHRFRYYGWDEVERLTRSLADRLARHLGSEGLRQARFVALPRGGHVVLGLLAVTLGLDAAQLQPGASPARPVVVVDDCALSGLRLGEYLRRAGPEPVVVATLLSPARLRREVLRAEPRVREFLSAADIGVLRPSAGRQAAARPTAGGTGAPYWRALLAPVALPWLEPESGVRPSPGASFEAAWPLCPPDRCLRNRPAPRAPRIERVPAGLGPLTPSPAAIFATCDRDVALASTESGEMFALAGPAAEVWRSVVDTGSPARAERRIARRAGVPVVRVREDVGELTSRLQQVGLLVATEAGRGGGNP